MSINENYTAVVGGQNGDEGKGKIVSYLIRNAVDMIPDDNSRPILVYRFQGGPNAGHTVKVGGKKYKLHQLPSGIYSARTFNLLGRGMYIDPRKLVDKEILPLQAKGTGISNQNLGIAANAHMILDMHVMQDKKNFDAPEHSSTGSGIMQVSAAKYSRVGVRFITFLEPDSMAYFLKNHTFKHGMPNELKDAHVSVDDFVQSYADERKLLSEFLVNEHDVFFDPRFQARIGEGAQGFMLDIDDGQYPGITSSNPVRPPHRPANVIGVFKAYTSSVGIKNRPFVAEFEFGEEIQKKLRDEWDEYGTTTGKPRHIGYFDALAAKYAFIQSDMDSIALTCLDRLEEMHKQGLDLKVVTGYKLRFNTFTEWHESFHDQWILAKVQPVYETFPNWGTTVEDGKLTPNAERYVTALEDLIGGKIKIIGVGPNDDNIILRHK